MSRQKHGSTWLSRKESSTLIVPRRKCRGKHKNGLPPDGCAEPVVCGTKKGGPSQEVCKGKEKHQERPSKRNEKDHREKIAWTYQKKAEPRSTGEEEKKRSERIKKVLATKKGEGRGDQKYGSGGKREK